MKRKFTRHVLWEGRFLRIVGKSFQTKTGNQAVWECVHRIRDAKIVACLAVTPQREVVLVKQYRFPLQSETVEMPAGLYIEKDESAEAAMIRELKEETGYTAKQMIYLHKGPYNSGLSGDEMTIFYAPEVAYAGKNELDGDDTEEIEVVKVPLEGLVDFCLAKHDEFKVDFKLLAVIQILEAKGLIRKV